MLGVVLIPGYAYNLTRRRNAPGARASRSMAATQITVTAFIFTAVALAIFGVSRHVQWVHDRSPDPTALIRAPRAYLLADDSRLLWVLAWLSLVTAAAVLLAWISAHRLWLPHTLLRWAAPAVVDGSAWHRVFRAEVPEGATVFVYCELHDGSYVAGRLAWYHAETDETPDRDLVLAPPLRIRPPGDPPDADQDMPSEIQRLVISARDVRSLAVNYYRQP